MSIPLSLLFYIYLASIAIFILFSFFNVYHILRFAKTNFFNATIIFLYLFISGVILFVSFWNLGGIDWQTSVDLIPKKPFTL